VLLETYGDHTHLNGRQTLAYARIRKIDSDISRAERQRKVLIALMDKLKQRNAQDIMSMAFTLSGYVSTNLSVDQIISAATTVLNSNLAEVEQFRLPINDSYVQETRNEQSMLYDTDWNANTQELYNFIYN
jgi:anionic cell wall polymer biosynthesis LytR-Cps2A-Psr (LCP) family protein